MNIAENPQLTIPRVSCSYFYDNRHLHRFFKMGSAPLLMSENIFPNIKEITESMGAFVAIHEHLIKNGIDRNSNKVDVYAIGDGHSPRTAALIACLTKWNCISIDPQMRPVLKLLIGCCYLNHLVHNVSGLNAAPCRNLI